MKPLSESQTQRAVLDYLSAMRIWHMRINTGAVRAEHNGKKRFVRYGKSGTADILAMPSHWNGQILPTWLEIKSPTGKQSQAQKAFQAEVESEGHTYILIKNIEEVIRFFEGKGEQNR